jgi:hypothetical protein
VNYVLGYIAIGVVTLAVYLRLNYFDLKNLLKLQEETRWERIRRTVMFPVIVIVIVISGWPFFAVMETKEYFDKRRRLVERNRVFEVQLKDLGEPLSVADMEAKEVVIDPLGAVPGLAFGHLNPAWTKFKHGIAFEDRLCPFDAVWTSPTWRKERRTGYARVRGKKIKGFFVSQIIEIPKE